MLALFWVIETRKGEMLDVLDADDEDDELNAGGEVDANDTFLCFDRFDDDVSIILSDLPEETDTLLGLEWFSGEPDP